MGADLKTHNKDFFYKYTRADRALEILTALTVWWCSPLLFNDPFDTHFGPNFGFSPEEVESLLEERLERIIYSDDPVPDTVRPALRVAMPMMRALRDKVPREQLVLQNRKALAQGAENSRAYLAQVNDDWQRKLRAIRVFCVGEVHDDSLMWAHYADCHRGAVIQFRCVPEKDTAICAARGIAYSSEIPVIARTAEEWVAHLSGDHRLDLSDAFYRFAFTKGESWSYEKEWRCWVDNGDADRDIDDLADPYVVHPEEIAAVYLGCRMKTQDRDVIVKVIRESLSHVKVFQARRSSSAFKLEFDLVR